MTAQAQPATIFSELLKNVCATLDGRATSEFELRRWEHEAEKLMRADRGEGLEIKAILESIRGNHQEAARLYKAALAASNDYTSTAVRYLSMLSSSLQSEQLLETFRALAPAFKGDPEATRFVERLLADNGFLISAWQLSDELQKMGSFSGATPSSASERATQHFEAGEFQDTDLGAPVAFAKRFLFARQVDWKSTHVSTSAGEDSAAVVFYQFRTDQSPAEASDLESELFGALEEKAFPAEMQGKLVFALVGTRVALS